MGGRGDDAFHFDHEYNPLLRKSTTSLFGNKVNKF